MGRAARVVDEVNLIPLVLILRSEPADQSLSDRPDNTRWCVSIEGPHRGHLDRLL